MVLLQATTSDALSTTSQIAACAPTSTLTSSVLPHLPLFGHHQLTSHKTSELVLPFKSKKIPNPQIPDTETFSQMPGVQQQQQNESPQTRRSPFALRHLYCLVTAAALAAAGMVSAGDIAFVIFSLIYVFFLSNFAFPTLSPSMNPPVFGRGNRVFSIYMSFATIIGLFLPIVYILEGVYEGDREGSRAVSPYLFLLCSQGIMEGVAFSDRFALPVRVFVPVFYNSRRIFNLVDWLRAEFYGGDYYRGGTLRLYAGRGLAVANMALWCFNLFGFLLPVYLPKAFKIYYSGYKVKD